MAAGHSWSGVFLLMYFGKHVLMWHEQDFCVNLPALWLTADQGFQLLPPAWDTIYWLIRSAAGHYTARVKSRDSDVSRPQEHSQSHRPFLLPVTTDSDWQEKPTQLEWSFYAWSSLIRSLGKLSVCLSFLFERWVRKWLAAKICKNKRLKIILIMSRSKWYDNSLTT